jgi:uncharacterized protein YkwD
LTSACQADSGSIEIQVVNDQGLPQRALVYSPTDPSTSSQTNELGKSALWLSSGDTLTATRQTSSPPCGAPENEGLANSVIVPSPVPATLTITLPSVPYRPSSPGLSHAESGFLGQINLDRAALGRAPLVAYRILNEAADNYARHSDELLTAGQVPANGHCALFSPLVRMLDRGWPLSGKSSETYARSDSASGIRTAYSIWKSSTAGHWQALMSSDFGSVGIGRVGRVTIAKLSAPCALVQCGPAEGTGNAAWFGIDDPLPASSFTPAAESPRHSQRAAGLGRLNYRRIANRQLLVRWRLKTRADGHMKVCLKRFSKVRGVCSRRFRILKHNRTWSYYRLTMKLPAGRSRLKVTIHFRGYAWWRSATLTRTFRLKRVA